MQIILFIGGIILFLIGIGLTFGFSWAMFLFELISWSHQGGYVNNSKETYRGNKNPKIRLVGLFLAFIGVFSFLFSLSL